MLRKIGLVLAGLLMTTLLHANGVVGVLSVRFERAVGNGHERTLVFVADMQQLRRLYQRITPNNNIIEIDVNGVPYLVKVKVCNNKLGVMEGRVLDDGTHVLIETDAE